MPTAARPGCSAVRRAVSKRFDPAIRTTVSGGPAAPLQVTDGVRASWVATASLIALDPPSR